MTNLSPHLSLLEVRMNRVEAEAHFAEALAAVCTLAGQAPDSTAAIAAVRGYHRELEALTKIETEILSNGTPLL